MSNANIFKNTEISLFAFHFIKSTKCCNLVFVFTQNIELMKFSWYRNRKVIITGGLGFIGSNLAIRLAKLGAKVTAVDSLIPQYGGNLFNINGYRKKITINIADVRDRYAMDSLVKDYEVMFNLAGTLSHVDSIVDPQTDLEINCKSHLTILEACRKNNRNIRIIFAGTRGQYGKIRYTPVNEKHPLCPVDINGINKNAGEQYHLLYHDIHNMKCCSLRLTNTYGPRHQMKHHKQGIVNWFIRMALSGRPIILFDDGVVKRDINYVDDVVEVFLLAGQSDKSWGKVYNIGGTSHSLKEIASAIIELAKKGSIKYRKYPRDLKKIEIGNYEADYRKITADLNWQPKTQIHSGLTRTIDFYRKYKRYYWSDS